MTFFKNVGYTDESRLTQLNSFTRLTTSTTLPYFTLLNWHYVLRNITVLNVYGRSKFIELIETYQYDPCNRLIRNDTDGSYYVPSELLESAATNISNQNISN